MHKFVHYSVPGGCGSDYRAQGSIPVYSKECEFTENEDFFLWEQCQMDFCVAAKSNATVIYPTRV